MESDDLRRCSCFSVWQLLPTTSLEKGYPRSILTSVSTLRPPHHIQRTTGQHPLSISGLHGSLLTWIYAP